MKYRLLELLTCVHDGGALRLENAKVRQVTTQKKWTHVPCKTFCGRKNCAVEDANVSPDVCTACYAEEITEGELLSRSGKRYSVINGIPRLLSPRTTEFIRKNKASFSLEWKYFRFGERNWGQDLSFRKNLLLKGLGKEPSALRGKTILDAGCGSGLLSMEMASSLGMEVIALDLATGIELAYARNTNPDVHFVQGSLLELPLRDQTVDLIYCAGVLIHLPNTEQAFHLLPRVLRPGGRYFVWIYRLIDQHESAGDRRKEAIYHQIRTRLTSRLPIRIQELMYLSMVVPFVLVQWVKKLLGRCENPRTWREKMQNFIDTFSPTYVNRHTEQEVIRWFQEAGFQSIVVAYRERYGFSVRGDMPVTRATPGKASAPVLSAINAKSS